MTTFVTELVEQRDELRVPDRSASPVRTFLPERNDTAAVIPGVRRLRGISRDEALNIGGALVSALAAGLLLFGRIAPLSGAVGFVLVTYAIFVMVYAVLVSFTEARPVVVDKVMSVLMLTTCAVAILALASVIVFVLIRGRTALVHTNFYTQDMSSTGPNDPLTKGGISHAIVGTLVIITGALVVSVPLGLTCAVFLTETRSKLGRPVRTIVDAMTALPSILAGLFIFATWILIFGFERSGLAASFAVSIMMLPIIIRSSDVVLRLVPGNLREASAALGAPTWRTVWHVVLPTARSGLTTSVILGVARGIGETAPVLLTSGFAASMNGNPTKNPMVSLPLAAFQFVRSPQPTLVARGFATAAVLMLLVLVLFTVARVVGGHPAGQVSKRQARRLTKKSERDAVRFSESLQEQM